MSEKVETKCVPFFRETEHGQQRTLLRLFRLPKTDPTTIGIFEEILQDHVKGKCVFMEGKEKVVDLDYTKYTVIDDLDYLRIIVPFGIQTNFRRLKLS